MKRLIFVLLLILNFARADEAQIYGGNLKLDSNKGVYTGVVYKSGSEDETLSFKLGLRKVNLYDKKITQTESLFFLKKELDLDEHLEFGYQNIMNDINNGNIYTLNLYKNDAVDYKFGVSYSNYDLFSVYQLNLQMNRFLGESPFYIEPRYYGIIVKEDRFYNSLDFKVGYIKGKHDTFASFLVGRSRYLVSDDDYYSCNFGYITKFAYKISYAYQLNRNLILKAEYYHYLLKDISNNKYLLQSLNLGLSYRY